MPPLTPLPKARQHVRCQTNMTCIKNAAGDRVEHEERPVQVL
jgi:hypothetical protein